VQAFPWVLSLLASLSYGSVMTRVPFSILDLDMDIAISPRGDARWTPTEAVRETVRLLWELETFLQQRGLLNPSTTLLLNNNGTLYLATDHDFNDPSLWPRFADYSASADADIRASAGARLRGQRTRDPCETGEPHWPPPPPPRPLTVKRMAVQCASPSGFGNFGSTAQCDAVLGKWNATWHTNAACRRLFPTPPRVPRCEADLGTAEFNTLLSFQRSDAQSWPAGEPSWSAPKIPLQRFRYLHFHVYLAPMRAHRTRRVRYLGAWWDFPASTRLYTRHVLLYLAIAPADAAHHLESQLTTKANHYFARPIPRQMTVRTTEDFTACNLSVPTLIRLQMCDHGSEHGTHHHPSAALCALRCHTCEEELRAQGAYTLAGCARWARTTRATCADEAADAKRRLPAATPTPQTWAAIRAVMQRETPTSSARAVVCAQHSNRP